MSKNKKFQPGDFVWIKSWYYDEIPQQIGIYQEFDKNSNPEHGIILSIPYAICDDHAWWFKDGEFRKATFEETEDYLKTIIKP